MIHKTVSARLKPYCAESGPRSHSDERLRLITSREFIRGATKDKNERWLSIPVSQMKASSSALSGIEPWEAEITTPTSLLGGRPNFLP